MASPKKNATDKMFLIIIDQLRADYREHLIKCSSLLTNPAICQIDSFPASTEATHGTISSSKYSGGHGFISRTAKEGDDGLEQLVKSIRNRDIPSLASLGVSSGFNVHVIGGKEETVRVMGDDKDCELMVYYKKDKDTSKNRFVCNTQDLRLYKTLTKLLEGKRYQRLPQQEWDRKVLELFNKINSLNNAEKVFYIITLSSLDKIGHDHGPNSEEVKEHLKFLDEHISSLIKETPSSVIITGDHGCRLVSKYVIEPAETDRSRLKVYNLDGSLIKFLEEHTLDSYYSISDMQYDGGILRLWLKDKGNLSENDLSFFFKYGYVFPHYVQQEGADKEIVRLYENSRHENLGDILVVARSDVMFCKSKWIEESVRKKISKKNMLNKGELPVGEHGTHHAEDREVCLLSSEYVKDRLSNTEIYDYIKSILS